jgi:hypothetical protein
VPYRHSLAISYAALTCRNYQGQVQPPRARACARYRDVRDGRVGVFAVRERDRAKSPIQRLLRKARRSPEWLKVSPEELVAAFDWACLDFQKG